MGFFKIGDDRRFVFAVVFSLMLVLISITWTYKIGISSNHYAHRLGHLEDGLKDLHKVIATAEVRK